MQAVREVNLQIKNTVAKLTVLLVELVEVAYLEPENPIKVCSLCTISACAKRVHTNLPTPVLLPSWSQLLELGLRDVDRGWVVTCVRHNMRSRLL